MTFVFLVGFKAQALEIVTDCSDLPMLQKAWEERYFRDFFKTSKVSPPKLTCNGKDQNKPYILAKAFWFLETAKTDVPGYYYQGAKKLINEIRADPNFYGDNQSCGGADVTHKGIITLYGCFFYEVDGVKNKKGEYTKKPYTLNGPYQSVYAISILVHELRHIDLKDEALHIHCNNDEECDSYFTTDLKSAGSYSYEIIYWKDILRNNKLSPEIRHSINSRIKYILDNHFPKTTSSRPQYSRSLK